MELNTILERLNPLLKNVGQFIQEESAKFTTSAVEEKSLNSLVTYVDKMSEEKLVEGLKRILPEAGFLTEEKTVDQTQKEYTWIIDPIDGTTNFIHRLPFYCISVALQHNQELILGAIYEMNRKELFTAYHQGGAYLNGVPITVSHTVKLKNAVLATGFPYYDYKRLDPYIQSFQYFVQNSRGLRRFGSAALDLAYVSCGRFDGFFEYGLNAWDVAAGIVLVREAGGIVRDFSDEDQAMEKQELIAGNPEIYLRMSNVVKGAFGK